MLAYKIQIIETVIAIAVFLITTKIIMSFIGRVGKKISYQPSRIKALKKAISFSLYIVFAGIFLLIWGIAPSQLTGYLASLFAVIGVAFFAQWSIISNITATIIIFFNQRIKIGDKVNILDKDYPIEGHIHDIGIFFISITTLEGERVTLPSNVFMYKMVKRENTSDAIEN